MLIPAAIPAVGDRRLSAVKFAMRDGSKLVTVVVSMRALSQVEPQPGGLFDVFKRNRKFFEQIASDKQDRSQIEEDGTVCIRPIDLTSIRPITSIPLEPSAA